MTTTIVVVTAEAGNVATPIWIGAGRGRAAKSAGGETRNPCATFATTTATTA